MAFKTVNDELVNRAIRHAVYVERLKTSLANSTIAKLNKDTFGGLFIEIESSLISLASKKKNNVLTNWQLKVLRKKIESIISKGMTDAYTSLRSNLIDIGMAESLFQANLINSTIPAVINVITSSIGKTVVESIVDSKPFEGAVLKDWFGKLNRDAQFNIAGQINTGISKGESVVEIVRRVKGSSAAAFGDGSAGQIRRHIEAVTRTSVNHVNTSTREATYSENDDIIKGVQIVATLDSRTTDICIAEDGRVYPIDEGWRPPGHWNCRTTTVPVLKSWEELGFNIKELPASTRASMNGQVSDKLTYRDWIKQQPAKIQDEALGATRGELLRRGLVTVDNFVDNRGRTLTLAELASREDFSLADIKK